MSWRRTSRSTACRSRSSYWEDNSEARNGKEGPFPRFLLDGKNRKEALKRIGVTNPNRAPPGVQAGVFFE